MSADASVARPRCVRRPTNAGRELFYRKTVHNCSHLSLDLLWFQCAADTGLKSQPSRHHSNGRKRCPLHGPHRPAIRVGRVPETPQNTAASPPLSCSFPQSASSVTKQAAPVYFGAACFVCPKAATLTPDTIPHEVPDAIVDAPSRLLAHRHERVTGMRQSKKG